MEKSQAPIWITKFLKYTESLGGSLITRYGFTDKDVGVYIFLFTRKLFSGQSRFNSYKIGQELNRISAEHMLEDDRINYGEKAVSESLSKLEVMGFIRKCNEIDRTNLKGAPPVAEYEAKNIPDVAEHMRKRLDENRSKKLDLLTDLGDIEENVGLNNKRRDENE